MSAVKERRKTKKALESFTATFAAKSSNEGFLKKEDGDLTRIRLDDGLRALDMKKPGEAAPAPAPAPVRSAPVQPQPPAEARILRQMATLSPGRPVSFDA
ncbi:MAG: hypothetical protein IJC01_02455, partial [Clostridia bacterium]|nr:hypothetical protein [Clostridia bacterium]